MDRLVRGNPTEVTPGTGSLSRAGFDGAHYRERHPENTDPLFHQTAK
jgi:hypothetical protein